jgi:hypothetical protein
VGGETKKSFKGLIITIVISISTILTPVVLKIEVPILVLFCGVFYSGHGLKDRAQKSGIIINFYAI